MLRTLLGAAIGSRVDRALDGRGGMAGAALGAAAARVATRSIPGAILIGGGALAAGMIGKRLRDRRMRRHPGNVVIDQPTARPLDPA